MGSAVNGTTRFALFGEVLLVGAVMLVLSAPVVTTVPALALGAAHLRRFLAGEADSASRLLHDIPPALRDLWPLGLLTPAALALLAYNVWFAGRGLTSGGQVVGAVSAAVATGVVVVVLRVAATWSPGQPWWTALRAAARRARGDFSGSALLVAAVVMCVVLVWMLTPMVLIIGGLLVLAMLAVENRLDRAGGLGKPVPG